MGTRDEERIEEEIAGIERMERPRGLAGEYLRQSIDALFGAGDPAVLYAQWMPNPPTMPESHGFMRIWARAERFRQARTSVLFAALGAEAYVNEFLAAFDLSKGRIKDLDKLPTIDKYLGGTREAYGESLFFEDREAIPELRKLFRLRHRLVHPKPGFGPPNALLDEPDPELEGLFALPDIAEFVIMVAGAADLMVRRAFGFDEFDTPGSTIWSARAAVRAFARRRVSLPEPLDPPESKWWNQLGDYLDSQPPMQGAEEMAIVRVATARAGRQPDAAGLQDV